MQSIFENIMDSIEKYKLTTLSDPKYLYIPAPTWFKLSKHLERTYHYMCDKDCVNRLLGCEVVLYGNSTVDLFDESVMVDFDGILIDTDKNLEVIDG